MNTNKLIHLLNSARGVYIPRDFIEHIGQDGLREWGLSDLTQNDLDQLADPSNEYYWEVWEWVLNNAHSDHGNGWSLYHDGDLWAVSDDFTMEEWEEHFGVTL